MEDSYSAESGGSASEAGGEDERMRDPVLSDDSDAAMEELSQLRDVYGDARETDMAAELSVDSGRPPGSKRKGPKRRKLDKAEQGEAGSGCPEEKVSLDCEMAPSEASMGDGCGASPFSRFLHCEVDELVDVAPSDAW